MVKPFLVRNISFVLLLSTIKLNLVAKTMQSAYLCVIFHLKHKNLLFLAVLTWFLVLGKIQDGYHRYWRHRPPAGPPPIKYTSSYREDQRLSTEGNIYRFKILQHIKNSGEGFHQPLPPCTTVGVWICVYVRGLIKFRAKGQWGFYCCSPFIISGFFRSDLPKMSATSAY